MKAKKKRKYNVPLSKSNLSEHENKRALYDPNCSYTGVGEEDGYPVEPEKPAGDADNL